MTIANKLVGDLSLTFDDVLLVPRCSEILPKDVNLKTNISKNLELNIPIVSAAMDTVTEANMAIAIAQEGGIGIIHKNMTITQQASQIRRVKKYEAGIITNPITIDISATLGEVFAITKKYKISALPVMNNKDLVGLVTSRDLRFVKDESMPVRKVMTPKSRLIAVTKNTSEQEIQKLLHQHRLERLLVVNNKYELEGMITVRDMKKSSSFPHASKDKNGSLIVGAAVGVDSDTLERVDALYESQVDLMVVDTAHGHSTRVFKIIKQIKDKYPNLEVVGGNIATAEAAEFLVEAGVDGVKVGIGPGSICTTRVVAGVGVPQISAIYNVAQYLKKNHPHIPVIADGGIRFSGDIAKAIVAGARTVMLGSMLAGTEEAPGEVEYYQGQAYKSYRGMGSIGAMLEKQGSADRYFQAENNPDKLVPEGIEGRVAYKGKVVPIVAQMTGGLRSAMGYTGCVNLSAMQTNCKMVRITAAGITESHVHDVSITKEAPNYRL